MEIFRMMDLMQLTGWSRKRLSQWLQQGIVVAEEPPRRAGCAAGFSIDNVCQFLITDKLVNAGISLRTAAAIAKEATENASLEYKEKHPAKEVLWLSVNMENTDERIFHIDRNIEIKWEVTLTVAIGLVFRDVHNRIQAIEDMIQEEIDIGTL